MKYNKMQQSKFSLPVTATDATSGIYRLMDNIYIYGIFGIYIYVYIVDIDLNSEVKQRMKYL